ncbi:uncharacterized protein LOC105175432 isoform X1 [Sesamum indicum]|uniref:Uncharacterized protein LOC105175432 isoform X1 n=1 Tax=Sesamum indicum TaxID=4182 RepID=A0A8M8VCJ7_SESIN|nr:uncharacterized protein LOC105175432 isoform X1 [Sesamum indicum]
MAFYAYKGDVDDCYWTHYSSGSHYDFPSAPIQASEQYSSPYEFGEPELFKSSSDYHRDYSFATPPELNYSVYTYTGPQTVHYEPIEYHNSYNYYQCSVNPSEINYSEPKFLQYEPPPDDWCYFRSETKFTVSSSTVEFNEPEFEEYDPTPYGGGYDPATTYGKPLPPSEITCYPRSVPKSDATSLESFSYGSIPSPYGKEDDLPTKPPDGSKPIDAKTDEKPSVETGDKVTSDGADGGRVEPTDVKPNDDTPSYEHQDGFQNGIRGGYGYGYESERQVGQIPYGSGLEAMDLCESIFGYWPCLAKQQQQRRKCREACHQERIMDPCKSVLDYLFGSSGVYDYENYNHQWQADRYDC